MPPKSPRKSQKTPRRPRQAPQPKLSWEESYREMAAAAEDWSEWDCTLADGILEIDGLAASEGSEKSIGW